MLLRKTAHRRLCRLMPAKRNNKGGSNDGGEQGKRKVQQSQSESQSQINLQQKKEEEKECLLAKERADRLAKRSVAMSLSQPTRAERAAERAADDRIEPWAWKADSLPPCDIPRGEEIILAADGACRRGERTRCACAVFDGSYDSPYSKAFKTVEGIDDSLKAETSALILLLKIAICIVEANPNVKKVKARIDCAPLHNAVQNGDILQYVSTGTSKLSSCQENLFNALRVLIIKLEFLGSELDLEWVPRTINIEPDELCNAVLDGRAPNANLRSRQHAPEITTQILFETLNGLVNKRRTAIRSLPMELSKHWQTFIYGLLSRYKKQEKLRNEADLLHCAPPHHRWPEILRGSHRLRQHPHPPHDAAAT